MKGGTLDANGKCRVCGNQPFCRHEIGSSGNDVVDGFWLVCSQCGNLDNFHHVDMAGNEIETCPWCGRTAYENPPVEELEKNCVWQAGIIPVVS